MLEEPSLKCRQAQMQIKRFQQPAAPRPRPSSAPLKPEPPSATQLELEWDDSYDACPVQAAQAQPESKRPQQTPAEPPRHIQEMRKSAIMLVKGSYIEESDFQDDVMVYDLVAKKDSRDVEQRKLKARKSEPEEAQPGSPDAPLKNGLSPTPPTSLTAEHSKHGSDSKAKGQMAESNPGGAAAELPDDFLAQYEELIRTLDPEAAGKQQPSAEPESKKPVVQPEEVEADEEEEMDFSSFSAETPEAEKVQSPFGPKFSSGGAARSLSVPFTGESRQILLILQKPRSELSALTPCAAPPQAPSSACCCPGWKTCCPTHCTSTCC